MMSLRELLWNHHLVHGRCDECGRTRLLAYRPFVYVCRRCFR